MISLEDLKNNPAMAIAYITLAVEQLKKDVDELQKNSKDYATDKQLEQITLDIDKLSTLVKELIEYRNKEEARLKAEKEKSTLSIIKNLGTVAGAIAAIIGLLYLISKLLQSLEP